VGALVLAASGTIGAKALYLLIAWLIGAASGAYLSERKGYGNKPGLASGLILSLVGAIVWLLIPARAGSDWKLKGPWGDRLKNPAGS
jgi:uncharacterized membrane protein YeaQ/YmgE (transglycosylase-associated protein family)